METLGRSLMTIGKAVAWIYTIGIGTKTFLIYTGKAKNNELKNWFW